MEIECKGCYYTLCSFVCLTEDLSEILQFLWRHGCLRRSYSCEKCGRKCAIGDKDLFFRCNRNTLDTPIIPQRVGGVPSQSDTQQVISTCQQTSHCKQQIQNTEDRPVGIRHQIEQITHNQFMIAQASSEASQQNSLVQSTNSENLLLFNRNTLRQSALLQGGETIHNDSVNLTIVPSSALSHNELNHNGRVLTVIDSQGSQILQNNTQNNTLLSNEDHNVHILPVLQTQSLPSTQGTSKSVETLEEPPAKILKKSNKTEGNKIPKKRCNFKVSMKKGTFFEKSKLPIDTVCKFVVFWCCMKHPTQEFLRNELSLATRTVVDWSTACREICIHWAKSVSEKIGGDGVMVQIDEVKIQDNKESKQNNNVNRFSFWGMEKDKEKGKIFIVSVPACDSWSLLTVVNDWILPGSVIISNCWKAYDCLKLQEFIQQTTVQSKTFVHPQNNAGQQNFDSKIEEAGASAGGELQMPRFGTRRSHHLGDLAEFMFKRRYNNHLERMHAFFTQISLAYPLH